MSENLDILDRLQADVTAILKAVPDLADAAIFSDNEGDIESEVVKKLGPLNAGEGGKRGLCGIVLAPETEEAEPNTPGPQMNARIDIQFIENVTVNRGSAGTGVRAATAAATALNALQLHVLGWTALYCPPKPVTPVKIEKAGHISRLVTLIARASLPGNSKCSAVVPQAAGGELSLTCATAGAAIWYTVDGSYPAPSNAAATLYTEPVINLDGGTLVRAAAYKEGLNPGDCRPFTVSYDPITFGTISLAWGEISTPWGELG
jgi:hypothetical protein